MHYSILDTHFLIAVEKGRAVSLDRVNKDHAAPSFTGLSALLESSSSMLGSRPLGLLFSPFLEIGSHIPQAGLEILILLPLLPNF